jgi:hypothetical protein
MGLLAILVILWFLTPINHTLENFEHQQHSTIMDLDLDMDIEAYLEQQVTGASSSDLMYDIIIETILCLLVKLMLVTKMKVKREKIKKEIAHEVPQTKTVKREEIVIDIEIDHVIEIETETEIGVVREVAIKVVGGKKAAKKTEKNPLATKKKTRTARKSARRTKKKKKNAN